MLKLKKQCFTMIEIVAMLAVVVVLVSAFAGTVGAVYRANETFISESKAVLVLGNVIEEIKLKETVSREDVKKLLFKEFRHSDLGKDERCRVKTEERNGKFVLSIIRTKDNRLLAEVKL